MAPSKLSDADKQTILELYHLPEETTSTLAERYGVSNSTISRLLKSQLPEREYALLIQQKRVGEKGATPEMTSEPQVEETPEVQAPTPEVTPPEPQAEKSEATPAPVRKVIPPIVRDQSAPEPAAAAPEKVILKKKAVDKPSLDTPLTDQPSTDGASADQPVDKPSGDRRRRSRGRAANAPEPVADQLPLLGTEVEETGDAPVSAVAATSDAPQASQNQVSSEEGLADLPAANVSGEDYDDDEDDLDDDDLDDEDDFDGDEEGGLGSWKLAKGDTPNLQALQISPLTAAALPGLCYVVVERTSSELVTCPLRDFSALGQVPEEEVDARTLPIFDNHRVARRFSRRNQRVVKVPDGTMLQKTSPYLQAKGITRLLIDGHIYALEGETSLSED
ncbi:MAG TPA: hypothetical protein V6D29_24490 [Leptolyngbyaceae cyanobacterium]